MNNPAHHASTYRAFTVTGRRQFALVERERHEPAPGQVRIRVEACGICHTDALAVEGLRPDPSAPIAPGHEIIGVIEAVGAGADPTWRPGDRVGVGVGFLGGQDNTCEPCRRGDFVNCSDQPQTGTAVDGGYAEVTYARATGLVRIPPGLDPLAGAPLLCAGLTMYNALISASARPGSLVAVQGLGGLATSASSTPARPATGSSPSPGAPPRPRSPQNSAPTTTSTARRPTPAPPCDEVFPLSEAPKAYERVINGDARFRIVLAGFVHQEIGTREGKPCPATAR
ncbi:alcohol dehydrogenase catalytic domain-containing protein [Nonomuraea rubra]|uniref:alcohol dehydrogenase n=1 Tax=Nonomuraea rubra TaxID=46180 RepID=A0A7X0U1E0_9ACTN|nr:alcohol dehydrogenase catalytic domain-containing protein [Nonomuraea rubra]MBB6551581.1 D-arabinose 1-dehydrogenase-like Zn-dependent alcohol dehydrogenase [Nonomuraea rubra]